MQDDIKRFADAVAGNPIWNSFDIKSVAVRLEGSWYNLYSRGIFSHRSVKSSATVSREDVLPNLRILHTRFPATEFLEMIDGLNSGYLAAEGQELLCTSVEHRGIGPAIPYSSSSSFLFISDYHIQPGGPWGGPETPRWSMERLSLHGSRMSDLVRAVEEGHGELENSLRSLDRPFDGVTGLLQSFIGTNATQSHGCTVEFFAPYEAEIMKANSAFTDGLASVRVAAESPGVLSHLKVGITATRRDGNSVRESIRLEDDRWEGSAERLFQDVAFEVSGAEELVALLSIGTRCINRLPLADTSAGQLSPRLRAYKRVDAEFGELDERLFGTNSAGRPFEEAVSRLFYLIGFSVDYLGGSKALSDGADFIAFADELGLCFVAEVTSSSLDTKGKLGKLVSRARRLAPDLEALRVIPLIISGLEHDHISSADRTSAAHDNVVVVDLEQLRTLRGLLGQDAALPKAIGFLTQ